MEINKLLYLASIVFMSRIAETTQCSEFTFEPDDYIGCFVDTGDRVLPNIYVTHTTMDNNRCISYCKVNGFLFAGTEASIYCFCGNDPYRLNNTPINYIFIVDYDCNYPCPGNSTQTCGGYWRLSIYRTGVNRTNQIYSRVGGRTLIANSVNTVTLTSNLTGSDLECAVYCKRKQCGVFSVAGYICEMYKYEDLCSGFTNNAVARVYMLT